MMTQRSLLASFALILCQVLLWSCGKQGAGPEVQDEAKTVGRTADTFPAADEDYFREMDRGQQLSLNEIKGRNN